MENNNLSNQTTKQEEFKNGKRISLLQKKVSTLRFFVYVFLASSVFLTSVILLWIYSIYYTEPPLATYYSVAPKNKGAYLYLFPREGHYKVGDEFTVDVIVNTAGNNVNAVAAYLSYPKDKMETISIDTSNSVFSIKFEDLINPLEGKIKIGLATPTPGVNVYNGKVATIKFKAKDKTDGFWENIYFDFSKDSDFFSGVFLDDMKGTNILKKTQGAKIIIE
jgi:hypothetical protein